MKRLLAIVCEVFHREACAAVAQSRLRVDLEFLPKSLHDIGEEAMSARLQATIDRALQARSEDEQPDAIVLLYGLCNNGICGLHAPVPLVVARAHDCITLLLGSRERYEAHFAAHPGTFYKSPGWIERDSDPNDNPASVTSRLGISRNYAELVEQFGEDNAQYLMETMGDWLKHYKRLCLINTGVGPAGDYRQSCRAQAEEKGWLFEEVAGDPGLIQRILNGEWDERECLVLPPGQKIVASHEEGVIHAEYAACGGCDQIKASS